MSTDTKPTYEQLETRLQSLETLISEWILPLASTGIDLAESYKISPIEVIKFSDRDITEMFSESKDWKSLSKMTRKEKAAWFRGYLNAKNVVTMNLGQFYQKIILSLKADPVDALHKVDRWNLLYVKTCPYCKIETVEVPDGIRLSRHCSQCDRTFTIEFIRHVLSKTNDKESE